MSLPPGNRLGDREILIDSIYSALEDPETWRIFLEQFARTFDVETVLLSIHYPDHPDWSLTARIGASKAYWHEIDTTWVGRDPWSIRTSFSDVQVGELRRSHEICPDEELEVTEMYRTLLKSFSLHYGGGMVLASSRHQVAVLSCLRSKEKGPLTEGECALWLSLAPHLVRAIRIHEKLIGPTLERELLIAHFNDVGVGLLLVKHDGYILLANSQAQELLGNSRSLTSVNGMLHIHPANANRNFREVLHDFGSNFLEDRDGAVRVMVPRSNGMSPLLLILTKPDLSSWITAPIGPPIAVRIIDPETRTAIDPEILQELFGLTAAESGLVGRLALGARLNEAAKTLHISMNTARTHLARCFGKTGTGNQAQLISLALRTAVRKTDSKTR